ncbi:MAG: histidine kinase [Ignavibacteria bacterium]|jgi:sensor histidine kinase YesM|nr:histidine kinase [Ignavibacteria bacterium]MCU7504172.1 histidine kinase [Ignavibacteria bacterium]MCU7516378.1 histidine kinase [Ignavibacteria bacterium]
MTRKQKYWTCQLCGWGFYTVILFFFAFQSTRTFSEKFYYSSSVFILQVGLTHIFRLVLIRHKWLDLPILKNILRAAISSLILALLIEASLFLLFYLPEIQGIKDINFNRLFVNYINRSFLNFAWAIIYFAIHYFENYNSAKLDALRYEMLLKDFELNALKSQMNPHFIFNALNSISGLINENPHKAQFALSQLSSLLRYSLRVNENQTVSLEEEMQIVNDYLELESIRYEERLKVKMDIDPSSLQVQVPPLMVQTLCENGIKHGISRLPEGGLLSISSAFVNGSLKLEIINAGSVAEEEASGNGCGIRNTRQRLSLLYGTNASFALKNVSGNFVSAEIIIPV